MIVKTTAGESAKFILIAYTVIISLALAKLSAAEESEYYEPDHIVLVFYENHSYKQILGSEKAKKKAPYINYLAEIGANMTQFYGIWHPSQPNYIGFFSGSRQGVKTSGAIPKELAPPWTTPNLGAQLLKSGRTFVGYSESMPQAGFDGNSFMQNAYARKHNPWANWQSKEPKENQFPLEINQVLEAMERDYSKLPDLSIVVPNQWNDMHNGTIEQGDRWLKYHMSQYIDWAKDNNSLFILTFDEDNGSKDNHIPTIFVGAGVKPGNYDTPYDLHSLRRTIQAIYNLPPLYHFKDEKIISAMPNKHAPRKPITEIFTKALRGAK